MNISIIINFIIIIIITTPINTLASISILQMVKFKMIDITMVNVYGCLVILSHSQFLSFSQSISLSQLYLSVS